jgi:hypothetical protein
MTVTFQFKIHTGSDDIARVAYELPSLPAGVSGDLHRAIKRYAAAVREGPDGADDEAFRAIKTFEARNTQDVIAKLLYQLHLHHRGWDAETDTLVITENKDADAAEIEFAAMAIGELYRQIPQDWASARKAYHAAVLAEKDYSDRAWMPAYYMSQAGGPEVPDGINTEYERLQEIRMAAEDVLLSAPAPSLAELAIKYLICFDGGRECTGCVEDLCAEAKRLLGIAEPTEVEPDELAVLSAVAAWESGALAFAERGEA